MEIILTEAEYNALKEKADGGIEILKLDKIIQFHRTAPSREGNVYESVHVSYLDNLRSTSLIISKDVLTQLLIAFE